MVQPSRGKPRLSSLPTLAATSSIGSRSPGIGVTMLSIGAWMLVGVAVAYVLVLIGWSIESKATLIQWMWAVIVFGLLIVAAFVLAVVFGDKHSHCPGRARREASRRLAVGVPGRANSPLLYI
ncbi:MAG: hypothetical protein AMJ38_02035 [Dehalococcoidia bacterium DG_22]|nr:MAG: hypothetical protein AMJ38_02035 [Dehalococcoidia bacterium DG_22]